MFLASDHTLLSRLLHIYYLCLSLIRSSFFFFTLKAFCHLYLIFCSWGGTSFEPGKAILENQPGVVDPSVLQHHILRKSLKTKFPNYMSDICTRYISRLHIKGNNRYIDIICLEGANIAPGRIALHHYVGLYWNSLGALTAC